MSKEEKGRKLPTILGIWVSYLPILGGGLPALSGIVSTMLLPFFAGGAVPLLALPFELSHQEEIATWILFGFVRGQSEGWHIRFLVAQVLVAVGLAITIVGLGQIVRSLKDKRLVSGGLYATIRHPQHLGIAIWTFGLALALSRTVGYMAWYTVVYFYLLLALREERQLIGQLGEEYELYKKNTPFMIPFIHVSLPLADYGWRRVGGLVAYYVLGMLVLCLVLQLVGVERPHYC